MTCEECSRSTDAAICRTCAALFLSVDSLNSDWPARETIELQLAMRKAFAPLLARLARRERHGPQTWLGNPDRPFDGWVYLPTVFDAIRRHDWSGILEGAT